jgi:cobalt-zinc-cadmium efflux system protein
MLLAIGLTAVFVLGEAVAGYFANSVALISDAGHNLADALALVFSWYAFSLARRPADPKRTFGYHRAGILAALVNAVSLIAIALAIFAQAAHRFWRPEPVQSGLMIAVAAVAILLNGLISLWLKHDAGHDLNIRSAYLHMLGDALSAAGVVAAGLIVAATGSPLADPMVALLIGGLIFWSSLGILTEAVNVLMEAAPRHLDTQLIAQAIEEVPGVLNVHDLHVWTVASHVIACSLHVLVAEQSVRSGQQVLRGVEERLGNRFGISHTTIQIEVEGCDPNDMYCVLRKNDASAHSHNHASADH